MDNSSLRAARSSVRIAIWPTCYWLIIVIVSDAGSRIRLPAFSPFMESQLFKWDCSTRMIGVRIGLRENTASKGGVHTAHSRPRFVPSSTRFRHSPVHDLRRQPPPSCLTLLFRYPTCLRYPYPVCPHSWQPKFDKQLQPRSFWRFE